MGADEILFISHIDESTTLLGPFQRFVIWVHGCCFDCKGCLAYNTKYGAYKRMAVEELGKIILQQENIEGITISGGEPFLQANALRKLIDYLRARKDLGVIIYSGFKKEQLDQKPEYKALLEMTDILIDGPYIEELDIGQPYIGSSNQVLHQLSDRYINDVSYYKKKGRRAEIKIYSDQVVLVGVPSKEALKTWNDLKEKARGMQDDFGN